jgi:hypothetical protein
MAVTAFSNFGTQAKGKIFSLQVMESYRGEEGVAPLIINPDTRWRWAANVTPRLVLLPKERTPVPFE